MTWTKYVNFLLPVGCMLNLIEIGPVVSEENSSDDVDGRWKGDKEATIL